MPHPFKQLGEIVDLNMGLGPHLPAFEISPNFGLGEVFNPSPTLMNENNLMQLPVAEN